MQASKPCRSSMGKYEGSKTSSLRRELKSKFVPRTSSRELYTNKKNKIGIQFDNLMHLDLSYNSITVFPLEIYEITSLNALILSHNRITEIHENIGNLNRLETLHLDNNRLNRRLPYSLLKLLSLKDFKASSSRNASVIEDEVRTWSNFEQIENGLLKWVPNPLMEIKIPVFVIGISSSGKSFISEFLRNKFDECNSGVLVWDILSLSAMDNIFDGLIANAVYVVTYDVGSSESFNLAHSIEKAKLLEERVASIVPHRVVRVGTYKNPFHTNKEDPMVKNLFPNPDRFVCVSTPSQVDLFDHSLPHSTFAFGAGSSSLSSFSYSYSSSSSMSRVNSSSRVMSRSSSGSSSTLFGSNMNMNMSL